MPKETSISEDLASLEGQLKDGKLKMKKYKSKAKAVQQRWNDELDMDNLLSKLFDNADLDLDGLISNEEYHLTLRSIGVEGIGQDGKAYQYDREQFLLSVQKIPGIEHIIRDTLVQDAQNATISQHWRSVAEKTAKRKADKAKEGKNNIDEIAAEACALNLSIARHIILQTDEAGKVAHQRIRQQSDDPDSVEAAKAQGGIMATGGCLACLIVTAPTLVVPSVMLHYADKTESRWDDCEENIALWLYISAIVSLSTFALQFLGWALAQQGKRLATKVAVLNEENAKKAKDGAKAKESCMRKIIRFTVRFLAFIQICACLFGFAWLIVGSVWVFPLEKKENGGTLECPHELWYMAFCWLIIQFCLICCIGTCGGIGIGAASFQTQKNKAVEKEVALRMFALQNKVAHGFFKDEEQESVSSSSEEDESPEDAKANETGDATPAV